jgi:hypothetical protein
MTAQPRITYPKPIRKAAKYRREQLAENLQLYFALLLILGGFALIMRALPYMMQFY